MMPRRDDSTMFSAIASKRMVRTRSGQVVSYTELDYGRASRQETARQHQKRKLLARAEGDDEEDDDGGATIGGGGIGTSTPRTPARARKTRAQVRQEEALATPPSAHVRVGVTPPVHPERVSLRGSRMPTCSDYGTTRHFSFKGDGYFFCHACDLWDSLPADRNNKSSRVSKRYACTAEHTSHHHPTAFRKGYCRRGNVTLLLTAAPNNDSAYSSGGISIDDDDDDDKSSLQFNEEKEDINGSISSAESDDDEDDASTSSRNTADNIMMPRIVCFNGNNHQGAASPVDARDDMLRQQGILVHQLKGKVASLREKNKKIMRRNNELQHELESTRVGDEEGATKNNERFKFHVLEAVGKVGVTYSRWSAKRKGILVAQAIWAQEAFLPDLLILAKKYFRENVFTPFNILREMDLAGGTLSYEGIDVLRRIETGRQKYSRGCIIPSKSEIKRMASMVEWYARSMCPFVLQQTSTGESVVFDYAKTLPCILRAFHLEEVGKTRSLSIAFSIDGASLSKNLSIIAGGIKITDKAARCPLTSKALLDDPATMKAQSRTLNLPMQLQIGRETKETFTDFGPLFRFMDDISETATLPIEMTGFKKFRCMTNCDLSAIWKGMCKGGACKVYTNPCTCCPIESEKLAEPNATLCARWCSERSQDAGWKCYHKLMATPEHVEALRTEAAELIKTLHCDLQVVQASSILCRHDISVESPYETSIMTKSSIHFIPRTTKEMQEFSRLLSTELVLRGLSMSGRGSMEDRREKLREALQREETVARLAKEISHGEVKEGAYFLLMHTLPCVLHMENRNGLKLLTMVIIEGLSNAKTGKLYCGTAAEGRRVTCFMSEIERIINTSILGSVDDPCQWICPFDSKKKELGPITMDNVRTRRVVDAMDILVDFCVVDKERSTLWTKALDSYRISMVLLRKREDFTNMEIASYQNHADLFYQAWVELWQKEGITNYMHMIGSGHVADYLYRWKNLYRFSQQGWEALNSLIKTFFFRRTSHGGGVRGKSKKSRLIPIGRWLQRRIVFLCRTSEDSIRQYAQVHPMPKSFLTQEQHDTTTLLGENNNDNDDNDDIYE